MAENKKVTISKTLNGNTIYYIARNSSGAIFARELTQEALQKAIKTYREPPPVKEPASVETPAGKEEENPVEATSAEAGEPKKKFLTNKLGEAVQQRKEQAASAEGSSEPKEEKSQKKKSFWDKLK